MKAAIFFATLCLLAATGVAQKAAKPKVPPKKPPPPKAKSFDGTLLFRTYVTSTGHKTEMRFAPREMRGSYRSFAVQIADMQGQKIPADFKTGSPLSMTGVVSGSTLRVARFSDVRRPRTARAAMDEVLTGSVKLLIVVLKFPGQATPVRISRIRTNVLGAVGANFATCSYGNLRLDKKSTIVGPIDVDAPPAGTPPCSADVPGLEESWFAQANAVLKARQINPTAWPYILYVLPTDPNMCLVKGWANLRCNGQATSGSDDPACYGAIYSTGANDQTIFLRELGYMLGSTDAAAAGGSPNGDRTTPMGNGTATCYNTPNLHKLGWIKPEVFCDGGQGEDNYDDGYGDEDDDGYYSVSQQAGPKQAAPKQAAPKQAKKPKKPKNEHPKNKHEEDEEDDDHYDDDDHEEDGGECTPLAVGDVQQVSIAMTVYGGSIEDPPQPGRVGIRIEPWDANQLPLYLGYVSARGPQAVVMNGLPMNLRRKTAIYTWDGTDFTDDFPTTYITSIGNGQVYDAGPLGWPIVFRQAYDDGMSATITMCRYGGVAVGSARAPLHQHLLTAGSTPARDCPFF